MKSSKLKRKICGGGVAIYGDPATSGYWAHVKIDLKGTQHENRSWFRCGNANRCGVLSHGKIYPCPRVAKVRHFNEAFDLNLPVTSRDYVKVAEVQTLEEIMRFYAKPIPFCRFCDPVGDVLTRWEISKKELGEWT